MPFNLFLLYIDYRSASKFALAADGTFSVVCLIGMENIPLIIDDLCKNARYPDALLSKIFCKGKIELK
ncbi:hypothetical protein DUZ99_08475 [Xylanibacillus composti]|nr:hypothetical protein [Xylanibacillus composti]